MAGTSPQQNPAANRRVEADGASLFFGSRVRFRVATLKPGFVLLTCHGGAVTVGQGAPQIGAQRLDALVAHGVR